MACYLLALRDPDTGNLLPVPGGDGGTMTAAVPVEIEPIIRSVTCRCFGLRCLHGHIAGTAVDGLSRAIAELEQRHGDRERAAQQILILFRTWCWKHREAIIEVS